MKHCILALIIGLVFPLGAAAQPGPSQPELSPYEQLRYGSKLWQVPREPYQSDFRLEQYKNMLYEPSSPSRKSKQPTPGKPRYSSPSPIRTPALNSAPDRAQQRFQSRQQWENEQRKISERSRDRHPGSPEKPAWQRGSN